MIIQHGDDWLSFQGEPVEVLTVRAVHETRQAPHLDRNPALDILFPVDLLFRTASRGECSLRLKSDFLSIADNGIDTSRAHDSDMTGRPVAPMRLRYVSRIVRRRGLA